MSLAFSPTASAGLVLWPFLGPHFHRSDKSITSILTQKLQPSLISVLLPSLPAALFKVSKSPQCPCTILYPCHS